MKQIIGYFVIFGTGNFWEPHEFLSVREVCSGHYEVVKVSSVRNAFIFPTKDYAMRARRKYGDMSGMISPVTPEMLEHTIKAHTGILSRDEL